MLCLHIPSLLPPPFTEMDVSSVAQIAAVAGVGMLYLGSAHRLMTEFLLGEIGRKPTSDKIADREAYVLSAGFALGMVNLGKGKSGAAAGLQDLKIEERLGQYLTGGQEVRRIFGASMCSSDTFICKISAASSGAVSNASIQPPLRRASLVTAVGPRSREGRLADEQGRGRAPLL